MKDAFRRHQSRKYETPHSALNCIPSRASARFSLQRNLQKDGLYPPPHHEKKPQNLRKKIQQHHHRRNKTSTTAQGCELGRDADSETLMTQLFLTASERPPSQGDNNSSGEQETLTPKVRPPPKPSENQIRTEEGETKRGGKLRII
ncbi:hypothetical protein Bca52824_095584 [Brassica carinata]|uniref:Uncharacterized protein n=1 Tax=Brassica carinata TaxID=52824 RepID=A0A8X7P290_BRACI|nr:hypothetical protein Bca52824_095584 [Brassica carinata]